MLSEVRERWCSDQSSGCNALRNILSIEVVFFLDPSDGVFGRFDLAALCGCRTLNFCLFVCLARVGLQSSVRGPLLVCPHHTEHRTARVLVPNGPSQFTRCHVDSNTHACMLGAVSVAYTAV